VKFKSKLKHLILDEARFKKALHEHLTERLVQGAFAWLTTVTDIVPVWTGASQSTFTPLASYIGYALSIVPDSNAYSRVELGIGNVGTSWVAQNGVYSFTYSTTLNHLIINEYQNANEFLDADGNPYFRLKNPGPYHFQEAGAKAFAKEAAEATLPGWSQLLRAKSITV
jgi:hypothetical protein